MAAVSRTNLLYSLALQPWIGCNFAYCRMLSNVFSPPSFGFGTTMSCVCDWAFTCASDSAHDMCAILGNAFLHLDNANRQMAGYIFLAFELLNGRACAYCITKEVNDIQYYNYCFFVEMLLLFSTFFNLITCHLWQIINLESESGLFFFETTTYHNKCNFHKL